MSTHDTHKPATNAAKISSPVQRAPEQAAAQLEAEHAEQPVVGVASHLNGPQQARLLQRMQRTVGNAQVQRVLSGAMHQPQIQRTPAAPKRTAPQQDPRFQAITTKLVTKQSISPDSDRSLDGIPRSRQKVHIVSHS